MVRVRSTDDITIKGFTSVANRNEHPGFPTPATTDSWKRQRSPNDEDLINEFEDTVFACANLNATALMTLPVRAYLRTSKNAKKSWWPTRTPSRSQIANVTKADLRLSSSEQIEEVTSHPMLDLIADPNPDMTWPELIELTSVYLDTVGRAYIHRPFDALGRPASITLMKAGHVRPIIDAEGHEVAYDYGFGKNKKTYPASEVIVIRMPLGRSPLYAVWESVQIGSMLSGTQASMLQNEAVPQLLISPAGDDGYFGAAEAARYEARFKQKFRRGGGGIWVVDEPVSVQPLSLTPRDLSALQIKGGVKIETCNAFGVPVALLEGNQFNRATLEAARLQHAQNAITPRAVRIAARLNKALASCYDPTGHLFLAFDDPSPEDRQTKVAEVTQLRNARIITGNEARAEYNLPPHEDGDVLVDPMPGMQGLDGGKADAEPVEDSKPEEQPQVEAPVADGKPVEDVQQQALNGSQTASLQAIIASIAAGEIPIETGRAMIIAAFPGISADLVADMLKPLVGFEPKRPEAPEPPIPPGGEDQPEEEDDAEPEDEEPAAAKSLSLPVIKSVRKPEFPGIPDGEDLGEVISDFYKKKRLEVVGGLQKGLVRKALPERFVPLESWTEELGSAVRPLIELYVSKSGKSLMDRVGFSPDAFDVTNPKLREAIDRLVFNFCDSTVASTTKSLNVALDELRAGLQDGLHAGDRLTDLRKMVNEIFDGLSKDHAFVIAATEASRAHHNGLRLAAIESGVVKGFRLMLSSDACPECQALEGKEIPVDGYFGRDEKARDGFKDIFVPVHVGCRCAVEEILTDD